ncbi:MAG: transposase domain-containing protein [Halothiobacillaceae bacterium]
MQSKRAGPVGQSHRLKKPGRGIAPGCKNDLFGGSDGGRGAAPILIGTARLRNLDPLKYLHPVIERINDHPVNAVDQGLPWRIDFGNGQIDRINPGKPQPKRQAAPVNRC